MDKDFLDMVTAVDKGYPIHQKLRKGLQKKWKKEKDFQKLIDYSLKVINKYYENYLKKQYPKNKLIKKTEDAATIHISWLLGDLF